MSMSCKVMEPQTTKNKEKARKEVDFSISLLTSNPLKLTVFSRIGMTGLEPATSTSLMWRSSQTEPHPDISRHKSFHLRTNVIVQHLFENVTTQFHFLRKISFSFGRFMLVDLT